ncbi:Phenolic acid decarboxylase [Baekduia alba]|uniref:UbiD family decarboxylase n=1 Tax=Baekduia alba TaxID=2997333 RepID=UPI0023405C53|nr:UbiD family decarboxylase [Baekduia alba]WCB93346.1 Phenolic acid decarboxylase [Baekduia alba]
MDAEAAVATPERGRLAGFDLRMWIEELRRLGELSVVQGADADLEVGAITDLNAKIHGPALLFVDIGGHEGQGQLLTCTLSRAARLASALGFDPGIDDQALVEELRGRPRQWREAAPRFEPVVVTDAPMFQNRLSGTEIDMRRFPAPLWHEGDGGRYLGTGGSMITRDPETGIVNCGTYRICVHDERRLGVCIEPYNHGAIHLQKYRERGEPCPVAITFGHGPLVYIASSMPLPYGVCELNVMGAMAEAPIDVIEGELTGLPIPASSELVIEGWINPGDVDFEGPFGEFTGYFAGGREKNPVIQVERVYFRDDPIVYGSLTGKPPFDHSYWRCAIESSMLVDELADAGIPDVKGAWKHEAGSANFFTVVAIKQRYAGHAQQVGVASALVAGGASMGRYVVVVDEDVDVMDLDEVVWCLSTRTDPARSIQVLRDTPTNPIDPMLEDAEASWTGSRAVINACRPFHRLDTFSKVVSVSPELAQRVRAQWGRQLGWPMTTADMSRSDEPS